MEQGARKQGLNKPNQGERRARFRLLLFRKLKAFKAKRRKNRQDKLYCTSWSKQLCKQLCRLKTSGRNSQASEDDFCYHECCHVNLLLRLVSHYSHLKCRDVSVRPCVRPSVRRTGSPELKFWKKLAISEQNFDRNVFSQWRCHIISKWGSPADSSTYPTSKPFHTCFISREVIERNQW